MDYPARALTYDDLVLAANAIAQRMPESPQLPLMNIAYAMAQLNSLMLRKPDLAQEVIMGEVRGRWLEERLPDAVRVQLRVSIDTAIAAMRHAFAVSSASVHRMHPDEDDALGHLGYLWAKMEMDVAPRVRANPVIRQYAESDPHMDEIIAAEITIAASSARAVVLGLLSECPA